MVFGGVDRGGQCRGVGRGGGWGVSGGGWYGRGGLEGGVVTKEFGGRVVASVFGGRGVCGGVWREGNCECIWREGCLRRNLVGSNHSEYLAAYVTSMIHMA